MINDFKLDSYHNPTLFIDDDKMFVAGSEDQSLHILQKQNLQVINGVMCMTRPVQVNGDTGSFL